MMKRKDSFDAGFERMNDVQLLDDRGLPFVLRSDPEGVFQDQSFRLMTRGGMRRVRQDPRVRSVLARRLVAPAVRDEESAQKRMRNRIFGVLILIGLSVLFYVDMTSSSLSFAKWKPVAFIFLCLSSIGVSLECLDRWSVRRRQRKARRDLPSLPVYCAGCWYPLSGIPVSDDGCKVCPECGAAWRLGDWGSA